MAYKWMGAMLVVMACGGFGIFLAGNERQEEAALRQLLQILDFMESDLQALEMDDFRERLQVQVEKAKEQVEGADAYQKRKEGEKGWSMQSV